MPTWRELVHLPEEELRRLDIALVNLACAAGLPGFEKIDVARCLQAIDAMADRARHWTAVHLPAFSKQPHKWDGSEAKFRIHLLVCTLQREFGVRYNPAKIPLEVPFECEDRFIHGIIQGDGGTCASLPVLYTAVGRRLGYPLKLVHAASPRTGYGHQFNRWDSPAERFNIELTRDGWDSPPDDYFRTGMYEISPELERDGCFLKSATPREELAQFLAEGGSLWRERGNHRAAVQAFAWASALAPQDRLLLNTLRRTMNSWSTEQEARKPPHFPDLHIKFSRRRFPETLPMDVERRILGLEATDNMLRDPDCERDLWTPMRQAPAPGILERPYEAWVDFVGERCGISLRFPWMH